MLSWLEPNPDPAHYRWSSYRGHGLGEANPLIIDHPLYLALAAEAEERQSVYRALFRAHLDEDAVTDIRKALSRGQPLGNERFCEAVEAALGERLKPKQRGRRAKLGDTESVDQLVLGL